ncbi:hypothetical protein [Alteromonas facilis]|uniref:hypothetical protein n=1 Tax=Alteromonas facilis TaxID=2048004 RepID=UPI000C28E5DC|nr:hypothetical protein [Alteromonas facilis]
MNIQEYTLPAHKHILAAWAASTAANNSTKFRFSVELGKRLLMQCNLSETEFLERINLVQEFTSQEEFDAWHNSFILEMLDESRVNEVITRFNLESKKSLDCRNFTYGIAAKMLNVYLKVFFLGELGAKKFADFIHPPIDRLLLEQLRKIDKEHFSFKKHDFPNHKLNSGVPAWTQLDNKQYSLIIQKIKQYLANQSVEGMWQIEFAWRGHQ